MTERHAKDSDCTVDPATGRCVTCGVLHGEPCDDCGARGYHAHDCSSPVLDWNAVHGDVDTGHMIETIRDLRAQNAILRDVLILVARDEEFGHMDAPATRAVRAALAAGGPGSDGAL